VKGALRQVRRWSIASIAGLVAGDVVWLGLEIVGHQPHLGSGLGVGAGVAVAALVAGAIEKRHVARQRLAQFLENNN
jgi:hypothetical protein